MAKYNNTISACAYMLCMNEDTLQAFLNGADVVRKLELEIKKLECDVEFYKFELEKQKLNFKQEKQQIIEMLNK